MSLILMSHEIELTFDNEQEATSAYAALEPILLNLEIEHRRGTDRAEAWVVRSKVLYDSKVEYVQAIADTVSATGNIDYEAREVFLGNGG
ncbi:hypothetical protein [Nesterenkonia sp. CF4.4]|uniref:hypothetical protein n=1 Tax=Nesterenkonia sp. CF4.4 TaxID=3373079 RepID=UPI003EE7A0B5